MTEFKKTVYTFTIGGFDLWRDPQDLASEGESDPPIKPLMRLATDEEYQSLYKLKHTVYTGPTKRDALERLDKSLGVIHVRRGELVLNDDDLPVMYDTYLHSQDGKIFGSIFICEPEDPTL